MFCQQLSSEKPKGRKLIVLVKKLHLNYLPAFLRNTNNLQMRLDAKVCVLLLLVILSLSDFPLWGQLSASDSVFYKKTIDNTKAVYFESLKDQSGLLNGSQYAGYSFTFKDGGHPFFYTDGFLNGTIVYDGLMYPKANLLYDEVSDVLLYRDTTHLIQLVSERVLRFSIKGYNFIRIANDSNKRTLVSTGFYQLLYEGNIAVLKKEVKSIREVLVSNTEDIYRYIDLKKNYYIKMSDVYHPVKRKKSLLELYGYKKKEIQQYIKRNKLNFKRAPDDFLIKTTAYYDQLTN
jgi:hypothetical protein